MAQRLFVLAASVLVIAAVASCDLTGPPSTEREVPTYRVVAGALSEGQATDLLAALGASSLQLALGDYLDEDGAVFFLDEDRFQFLPTIDGQTAYSQEDDEEFLVIFLDEKGISEIGAPPNPDLSLATVQTALLAGALDPQSRIAANAVRVTPSIGHSNFEWIDTDGTVRYAVELDTHVDLDVELATGSGFAPLIGAGGSIKVVFDASGPTLVHYELWGLEPGPNVTIMAENEALQACRQQFSGSAQGASTTAQAARSSLQMQAELVYYAPPFEVATATVYPYYLCSGSRQVDLGGGGSETIFLRPTFVKATPDAPDIVEPHLEPIEERPEGAVASLAFGVRDAGTEWVGESDGLPGSRRNAGRFIAEFALQGDTTARFNWGDENAWERDFKDPAFGGNDTNWIDNVDIAFYTGHASGNGFTFTSNRDDGALRFDEARWGNHDLEWLVIAACGPLQPVAGGRTWWERWGPAFHGLHLLMAYANDSLDNEREGRIFARAVLGRGESAKRVRHAWVKAATRVQPSTVTYAVMGVGNSSGVTNWNDFFWGRGTGGGPDIPNAEITFYWRLFGPS